MSKEVQRLLAENENVTVFFHGRQLKINQDKNSWRISTKITKSGLISRLLIAFGTDDLGLGMSLKCDIGNLQIAQTVATPAFARKSQHSNVTFERHA